MGDINFFTIRLDDATVPVCVAALADSHDGRMISFFRDLNWGVRLTVEQGETLRNALVFYSENEVREGSANYRRARHLAATLEDHIVMLRRPAIDEASEEIGEDYSEAARMANLERERQNKLRDEMLREVFLGGPRKKLNIWGNVVDEEALSRNNEECEIPHQESHILPEGKALKFDRPLWVPLKNTISDSEAHDLLTRGSRMTYNEDMKVEGAVELLKKQKSGQQELWNRNPDIPEGVVSTVSAFLKKTSR